MATSEFSNQWLTNPTDLFAQPANMFGSSSQTPSSQFNFDDFSSLYGNTQDNQGFGQYASYGNKNPADSGFNFMDLFSKENMQTLGSLGKGAAGLGQLYLGYKQTQMAEDAFDFQKDAYEQNTAINKQLTNSQIADRNAARKSTGGNYQDTSLLK